MAEKEDEAQIPEENMSNSGKEEEQSDEEEELYEVEQIIGKSKIKGTIMYKVRWRGFGPEDDTWEPIGNVESCQDLIEEFVEKQNKIMKKRSEERKIKQALMEGRLESTDSSDSNSYPENFKNIFWKELEAGRVNVFDNDMYSKVKNRAVTASTSSTQKSEITGKKTRLCRQQKKSRCVDFSNVSDSESEDDFNKSPQKLETDEDVTSTQVEQESDHTEDKCQQKQQSYSVSSDDTEQPMHIPLIHSATASAKLEPLTHSDTSGGNYLAKPSLNLVIKKIPEITDDMGKKCTLMGATTSSSYTVLPKTSSMQVNNDEKKDSSTRHSSPKKKKHHKHHKHKSRKSSPHHHYSKDKKRKVSSTSLTSFPSEGSKCLNVKVPRLDGNGPRCDSNVLVEHNIHSDNIPDLKAHSTNSGSNTLSVDHSSGNHDKTNDKTVVISESRKFAIMTMETSNNHNSSNSLPSSDLMHSIQFNKNTMKCVNSSSVKDVLSNNPSTCSNTDEVLTSAIHVTRQVSEQTVDSGIHSPASEKSEALFRQGSDDKLLVAPSDHSFRGIAVDQDLGIELDDIDWNLSDTEATLDPITVTDDEFAHAVMSADYQLVKHALICDGKYDMEHPDAAGKTLLMWTVHHGHDDISDLLIEHGADINAQMVNGMTALMIACHAAEICTVNLLLELGAKVNIESKDKKTALIIAAKRGVNQIVSLLLECGANFNTVSQSGHTALDYVKLLQHKDTEVILTSHISRVMSEFNKQVSVTLNKTAKVLSSLFQPHLFNVSDADTFEVEFQHDLQPPNPGLGYLLFIGNAVFANQEVKCRLYGPSAVKTVILNGHRQSCLTEEGDFVLAFAPLVDGSNLLTIHTVKAPESKAKLIVCAYMAQLC